MSSFTFRPGSMLHLTLEELQTELDRSLPRLYDAHNTLRGIGIQGPALNQGFAIVSGSVTFTGSQKMINTGLAEVKQVTATIQSSAATNITVTAVIGPVVKSQISLYAWQPTSSGNNTPVAATTAVTVHWSCSGVNSLNVAPTA